MLFEAGLLVVLYDFQCDGTLTTLANFAFVFVTVGQATKGEEKAIRKEKGARETVELEDHFSMNVFITYMLFNI